MLTFNRDLSFIRKYVALYSVWLLLGALFATEKVLSHVTVTRIARPRCRLALRGVHLTFLTSIVTSHFLPA